MRITSLISLSLLTLVAGCSVKDVDQPALAGPSTLATSITMKASPDILVQDGASQSVITITALDAEGRPKTIPLRADITVDGVVQDYGRLSTKQPVTNGSPLIYTAPATSTLAAGQVPQRVTILITPTDGSAFDARGEVARQVDIRLVPQGIIQPTNPNLVASFTVTPASPQVMGTATFDASATTNNAVACNSQCTYSWDFGDGTSGTGVTVTHVYRTASSFVAVLTVTDSRGAQSTTSRAVVVAPGTPPTPAFTFSPTPAVVDQTVFFNAAGSRAATGRTIVKYDWDFGKGTTGSGVTVSKSYESAGTYTVTLTVTDDAGAAATTSQPVTVTNPQPNAAFTVTPSSPAAGETVIVNASSTTGPSAIVSYIWDFGVGASPSTGVGVSSSTSYPGATVGSTKVITLTVTDSAGRTSVTSRQVTIK
jgi:PKD repeat protein